MPWLPDMFRRLHYYLGLYFLWFLLLFSFTGLLLNHHWSVSEFWPKRSESVSTASFRPVANPVELMGQLGLTGELKPNDAGPGRLDFQVVRPGEILRVQADLATRRAEVRRTRVNAWGVMHMLHTFSGPKQGRQWLLTRLWTFSMDALAVGLIVMVLSGYYIWYRSRANRRAGWIAVTVGVLACGFFLFGLAWM